MKKVFINFNQSFYRLFLKRIIFLFNSELIHEVLLSYGEILGRIRLTRFLSKKMLRFENASLSQKISGIEFKNPLGLAAGFDYKASLPQILPSLGFGFGTVGTITYYAYEGNPKPRLARLVKSKALLVNKGFKNSGIASTVKKLKNDSFSIPIGISIGKTNSRKKTTQKEAVEEIIKSFKAVEKSKINFGYYELNISCPNLYGNISFYSSKNLDELLRALDRVDLKKPVFIKMPIEKRDDEVLLMLDVISKHKITGVIFGNLQKDRSEEHFHEEEVKKYKIGNFSGKPTEKRSNELIKLAYKNFGKKLIIIGCGGIFSANDAYKKIKLGASLVQLITGLIFEGPLLAAEINAGLTDLLKKDGHKNISEAIGKEVS